MSEEILNEQPVRQKRKYTRHAPSNTAEKQQERAARKYAKSKIEEGYQQTVRLQMEQINGLVKATEDIQADVLTLKAERDELLSGLLQVRSSIDKLYELLNEGEETVTENRPLSR